MHSDNDVSASAVRRTALDALQAKISAIYSNRCVLDTVESSESLQKTHETDNRKTYRDLLTSMGETVLTKPRRQSPLVNVGYAVRVTCILHHIKSFLIYCRQCQMERIQLVVLGAGLDVTGLWALLQASKANTEINVVEIDFLSICEEKKRAIQHLNLLTETDNFVPSENIVWQGESLEHRNSSYALASLDLDADHCSLGERLGDVFEKHLPTVIISELVLTYLNPTSCDRLLQWCSSETSCLILYEPLAPKQDAENQVLELYKSAYCNQFSAKLRSGKSANGDMWQSNDNFHPLGSSCNTIEDRLRLSGFDHVYAATAGRVASSLHCDMQTEELFDEHAALTLHLSSYALACCFPSSSPSILRRSMRRCFSPSERRPWTHMPEHTIKDGPCWIFCVEREDDEAMRTLFANTYKHLFSEYPPIRKMVNTALQKDLCLNDEADESNRNKQSRIRARYLALGGDFLVAVRSNPHGSLSNECTVVGGIGVRQCTMAECASRQLPANTYEIHRLFVDSTATGRGIGTALLHEVFAFVRSRRPANWELSTVKPYCTIVATTPTVMVDANRFYASNGFSVKGEKMIGEMTIRTYKKAVLA